MRKKLKLVLMLSDATMFLDFSKDLCCTEMFNYVK